MNTTTFRIILLLLITCVCSGLSAQDYKYLRVENVRTGWNKLKIGNNPTSFWSPKVDVTAGGNTHMEIEFRIPEGSPDMTRLQVRPNGYGANPVKLSDYLPPGFSFGFDWHTVSIPLADFDAGVNLTQVNLLQLPYSNNTGLFVMEIRSISFTGGSSPYLWFGDGKRDNIHDGQGNSGQMTAAIEQEYHFDLSYDYPGKRRYTEYFEGYSSRSEACQEVRITCLQDDSYRPVTLASNPVSACSFVPGTYQASAVLKNSSSVNVNYTIPASSVMVVNSLVTPPSGTTDGLIEATLSGGAGSYFYESTSSYFGQQVVPDSSENKLFEKNLGTNTENLSTDSDLLGNMYVGNANSLTKYNTGGNITWSKTAVNGNASKLYVDPVGNAFMTFNASSGFSIGSRYLGNDGNAAVFVKFSPAGEVLWMRRIPGLPDDMTGDGQGSIYLVFNDSYATLSRYGVNGQHMWTKTGNSGGVFWSQVTADPQGNIYAGLTMAEGSTFDGIPVTGTPPNNGWAGNIDAGGVLIKTDSSGTIDWLETLDYSHTIRGMSCGDNGIVYVVSQFDVPLQYAYHTTSFIEGRSTLNGGGVFLEELTQGLFYTTTDVDVDPAGLPYAADNSGALRRFDPFGDLLNTIYIPEYVYAHSPYISVDGTGLVNILGMNNYGEGYIMRLAPATHVKVPVDYHLSGESITFEDARGQSVVVSYSFTTASITGISATLDNTAYEVGWEPPLSEVLRYEVYRKTGERLQLAGTAGPGEVSFTDLSAQVTEERPAYVVKAILPQSENLSNEHTPMALNGKPEAGGIVNLQWSAYYGYDKPAYSLYRGTEESNLEKLTDLKAGQLSYTDKLPAEADYIYKLVAKETASGKHGSSQSNLLHLKAGQNQPNMTVWPNPAANIINCHFEGRDRTNTLQLTDLSGKLIATYKNINPEIHTISRGDLSAGIYLLTFEDTEGKITERVVFR